MPTEIFTKLDFYCPGCGGKSVETQYASAQVQDMVRYGPAGCTRCGLAFSLTVAPGVSWHENVQLALPL